METWACTSHKPKRILCRKRTVTLEQFKSQCFCSVEEWEETRTAFIFIDYSVGEGFPPVSTLCPALNE